MKSNRKSLLLCLFLIISMLCSNGMAFANSVESSSTSAQTQDMEENSGIKGTDAAISGETTNMMAGSPTGESRSETDNAEFGESSQSQTQTETGSDTYDEESINDETKMSEGSGVADNAPKRGEKSVYFMWGEEYIVSIDGQTYTPDGDTGVAIPVGASVVLQAPETDSNGGQFKYWKIGFTMGENTENLEFSSRCLSDRTKPKTTMTVLDEMNDGYNSWFSITPVYENKISADEIVKVKIVDGIVDSYTGNVKKVDDSTYECSLGAVFNVHWSIPKEAGYDYKFSQWNVISGCYNELMESTAQSVFVDRYNEKASIIINESLYNNGTFDSLSYVFAATYERFQGDKKVCHVTLDGGEIIRVDGVNTNAYNKGTNEKGEAWAEGYFPAGTVLTLQTSREDPYWWLYWSKGYDGHNGSGDTLGYFTSENGKSTINYVVPEQSQAYILCSFFVGTGDRPVYITMYDSQITADDSKTLATPMTTGYFDSSHILQIEAVAPAAEAGYKYVFDRWECSDGYTARFEDRNASLTVMSANPSLTYLKIFAIFQKVPESQGNLEIVNQIGNGAPGVFISRDTLFDTVLSDSDKEALNQGNNIKVTLAVDVVELSGNEQSSLDQIKGSYEQGVVFSVRIIKQVGNGTPEQDATLLSAANISVNIPKSLMSDDTVRSYAIGRICDGAATLLTDVQSTAGVVTMTEDRLSTYVLMYSDSPSETTDRQTDSILENANKDKDGPKTGDYTPIMILLSIFCISAVVIVFILAYRKVKKHHK